MPARADFPDSSVLLEHAQFVHAVARGLLATRDDADDVAQDTWLRALRAKASAIGEARGWLATIARNRARDVGRGNARRRRRELAAAKPEAVESVDESYARLSAQRDVVGKVLELDEPYRSVVILRYYHELPHDEIARRLGSKPATVRTQLVRAHAILRTKLDREYGDRNAWAGLLLPATSRGASLVFVAAAGVAAAVVVAFIAMQKEAADVRLAAAPYESVAEVASLESIGASASHAVPSAAVQRSEVEDSVHSVTPAETLLEPAELFDRSHFRDYEKATFSFVHGMRDDPLSIALNDWDLKFENDTFTVITVVDDTSLIVDLGEIALHELSGAELQPLCERVAAAAQARADDEQRRAASSAPALSGHTYFVWTKDGDTDLAAAFEVMELRSGELCMLDWYATSDGVAAKGSLRDSSPEYPLIAALWELRLAARSSATLREPRVVLQLRSGAVGGNPVKLDVSGAATYLDRFTREPLDLRTPVEINDEQTAFVQGGFVPPGLAFVVTHARWQGIATGDSNGGGELRVDIDGETLFLERSTDGWIEREWRGRAEIRPGEEDKTFLQVRNSSAGELVLMGEFETVACAVRRSHEPIATPFERTPRKSAGPRLIEHQAPRIELALRGSSGGSDTARVAGGRRIEFKESGFSIQANVRDRMVFIDLGEMELAEVAAPAAGSSARADLEREAQRQWLLSTERVSWIQLDAAVNAGHAYLIVADPHGREPKSALLRVVELEAGKRCVLDHYTLSSAIGAHGSVNSGAHPKGLARVLGELVDAAAAAIELRTPLVEMQIRNGGGNRGWTARVAMAPIDAVPPLEILSGDPLDLEAPETAGEKGSAYLSSGFIPRTQQFVVTRIVYGARPNTLGDGCGQMWTSLPGSAIPTLDIAGEPVDGEWTGELVIRPGDEHRVSLQATGTRSAWLRLEGRFEPLEER